MSGYAEMLAHLADRRQAMGRGYPPEAVAPPEERLAFPDWHPASAYREGRDARVISAAHGAPAPTDAELRAMADDRYEIGPGAGYLAAEAAEARREAYENGLLDIADARFAER